MINLIVACGHNRVIGKKGRLPWSIEEDWDYFLKTTAGGTMIMGKTCYDEFEPYIEEQEIIGLTRDNSFRFANAKTAHSLKHALSQASLPTVWICGGASLYKESMPIADRLYITKINHSFDGDVFFPPWEKTFTQMVSCTKVNTGKFDLEFMIFEKNA